MLQALAVAGITPDALTIVGSNSAALALARYATILGWDLTLVDDRDDRAIARRFGGGAGSRD